MPSRPRRTTPSRPTTGTAIVVQRTPGRPTAYKPEYAKRAAKLCQNGAIDTELAAEFNCGLSTLYGWKNRYPEFRESIKRPKEIADQRVEDSLYQKAIGYTIDTEKILNVDGRIVIVPTAEYVPADTAAAFIWLKNRQPEKWRDRHEVVHKGELSKVSDEELEQMLVEKVAKLGLQAKIIGLLPAPRKGIAANIENDTDDDATED